MRRRHSFEIILVGQSSLLREGVAKILRSENFRIADSVSCADYCIASNIESQELLFLIVHTSNDFDFVAEQIELLRESRPEGRVAIVADHYRPDELVSAFRAGASGYFVNFMTCDVFIKSIELIMMGETVLPPAFLSDILSRENGRPDNASPPGDNNEPIFVVANDAIAPQLTPRQKLILCYLVEGSSNKSIARKLDITEATVKVHMKAILRKTRVHNRTQAAIWGMHNGWQPPTDTIINAGWPDAEIEKIAPRVAEEANNDEVPRIARLARKDADLNITRTIRSCK